jgi:hypothetical protein
MCKTRGFLPISRINRISGCACRKYQNDFAPKQSRSNGPRQSDGSDDWDRGILQLRSDLLLFQFFWSFFYREGLIAVNLAKAVAGGVTTYEDGKRKLTAAVNIYDQALLDLAVNILAGCLDFYTSDDRKQSRARSK